MKIGIDARLVAGRNTGDRTYWRGLLTGLSQTPSDHEFYLYVRRDPAPEEQLPLDERFHWRVIPAANERLWSLTAFPFAAGKDRVDVAHVQYTVPPLMRAPVVTTIADISFKILPQLFPAKDAFLLGRSIPSSIRRAAAVIGVSESTRNDILTYYPGTPPEKVHAIYNGIESRYRPRTVIEQDLDRDVAKVRYTLDKPFVLCVGLLQPRKNVPLLLRAFTRARNAAGLPHVLAVAGRRGWLAKETENAIAEAGDAVVFLGYVPDDDLPSLYGTADALAFPSLYEGFGLPVAEAMACGCPVICGNTSSLPEVAGDAAILVSPTDEGAWTQALTRLLTSPELRRSLGARGIEQARRFSWRTAAEQTLAVYEAAALRA
ncbi:MAG: glycosyltransferase family 1 protein [Capsulimonadaceae bacterium]|nr:glycosyltransferase family 1 protein [Capsulimonadaceae bacterium]